MKKGIDIGSIKNTSAISKCYFLFGTGIMYTINKPISFFNAFQVGFSIFGDEWFL